MKSVFVYEHLSGRGDHRRADGGAAVDEALRAEGLAMRDALLADLCRLPDVAVEVGAARDGETALDVVARGAARHSLAWVVAPETGGLLARLQGAVPPARWLGCTAAAIAIAGSKRATLRCLAASGICTPLAFDAADARWVVKPDDGAGAQHTQVHADRHPAMADLAERERAGLSATMEPWVDGEAMSLSLLCGRQRAELLSVNRQQLVLDANGARGAVDVQGLQIDVLPAADPRRAPLHALAKQVFAAIDGLRGFVGIDFVWHAQRGPVAIEVNPRLTSAYVGLSAALGRNLAAGILAEHEDEFAHA